MPRWKAWLCRLGMPGRRIAWRSSPGCGVGAGLDRGDAAVARASMRTSFAQPSASSACSAKIVATVMLRRSRPHASDALASSLNMYIHNRIGWKRKSMMAGSDNRQRAVARLAQCPAGDACAGACPGLGIVERGAVAARRRPHRLCRPGGRAAVALRSKRRDHRLRRPLDHARPDRLPHPSGPCRQPRQRVRDAAGRRDL